MIHTRECFSSNLSVAKIKLIRLFKTLKTHCIFTITPALLIEILWPCTKNGLCIILSKRFEFAFFFIFSLAKMSIQIILLRHLWQETENYEMIEVFHLSPMNRARFMHNFFRWILHLPISQNQLISIFYLVG